MSIFNLSEKDKKSFKSLENKIKLLFIYKEPECRPLLKSLRLLYNISSRDRLKDIIIREEIEAYIDKDNIDIVKKDVFNQVKNEIVDDLYVNQILILYGLFESFYNNVMGKIVVNEKNAPITLNFIKHMIRNKQKIKFHKSLHFDKLNPLMISLYDLDILTNHLTLEDVELYKTFIDYRHELAHNGQISGSIDIVKIIDFHIVCMKILELICIYDDENRYKIKYKRKIGNFEIIYERSGKYYLLNEISYQINKDIKNKLSKLKCFNDPKMKSLIIDGISIDQDLKFLNNHKKEINQYSELASYFDKVRNNLCKLQSSQVINSKLARYMSELYFLKNK